MKGYEIEQPSESVLNVRMSDISAGWEQWFLLISDVHWDNPHCDRKLLHRLMTSAKDRDAGVFCFGDFFCAMQGKNDRRGSKSQIRPEHQVDNYFDALVDTATEDMSAYADIWEYYSDGNHETAIRKHGETDLVGRLCKSLNIRRGGYSGFIRFLFQRHDTGGRSSKNLFYHHGSGGGGPVTKGVIQTNRRAVWLPDADIVATGHVHESWVMELPRQRLSAAGELYLDSQWHIQLATMKQEFDLQGGWHIERGAPPKPLGGWWLRWKYDASRKERIGLEIIKAD